MVEPFRERDAVRVESVSFRYPGLLALDCVSFAVSHGVTAILGPNGAGKSTLLRLLVGLTKPTEGSLEFDFGAPNLTRRQRNRFIGFAPQTLDFYPNYTVMEYVRYIAWLKQVERRHRDDAISRALASTDLTELAGRKLRALSGGMVRRLAVAQAFVNDPRLLVLDEPAAGLDPEQRIEMRAILREIGRDRSLVVSTHHVDDLVALADRVIVLSKGRITFTGDIASMAALSADGTFGDTELERAYSAALAKGMPSSHDQ